MPKPLTRTAKTMRHMGPLTRELQGIQNDLVKLARRLDKFQERLVVAEGDHVVAELERRRAAGTLPTRVAVSFETVKNFREKITGGTHNA